MANKVPRGSAIFALSTLNQRVYVASNVLATVGLVVAIIGEHIEFSGTHGQTSGSTAGWVLLATGAAIAIGAVFNCWRLLRKGRRAVVIEPEG